MLLSSLCQENRRENAQIPHRKRLPWVALMTQSYVLAPASLKQEGAGAIRFISENNNKEKILFS